MSERSRIIATVISQFNENPVRWVIRTRKSPALVISRRRVCYESNKTNGRTLITAVCTVKKAHLVQQQNGMNESSTADVATSSTVICRLIRQRLLCMKSLPYSEKTFIRFLSILYWKSLLCPQNERTVHSPQRRYPEPHAFSPHCQKNWFISVNVRENGSHWFA
jgi:hypothetical protein